jgi:hypothetical protein
MSTFSFMSSDLNPNAPANDAYNRPRPAFIYNDYATIRPCPTLLHYRLL